MNCACKSSSEFGAVNMIDEHGHGLQGAGHKQGPNLHGLIGRVAGTAADYSFSAANKSSGKYPRSWCRSRCQCAITITITARTLYAHGFVAGITWNEGKL